MAVTARIVDGWYVTSDGRISHFTERELHRGTNWIERASLPDIEEKLIDLLQALRDDVRRMIWVNSGVRSKRANASAGGDSTSLHLTGGAADLEVDGMRGWQLVPALERVTVGGSVGRWGIYHRDSDGHCHVDTDTRKTRRRFVVQAGVYYDLEVWAEKHFPGVALAKIPTVEANRALGF